MQLGVSQPGWHRQEEGGRCRTSHPAFLRGLVLYSLCISSLICWPGSVARPANNEPSQVSPAPVSQPIAGAGPRETVSHLHGWTWPSGLSGTVLCTKPVVQTQMARGGDSAAAVPASSQPAQPPMLSTFKVHPPSPSLPLAQPHLPLPPHPGLSPSQRAKGRQPQHHLLPPFSHLPLLSHHPGFPLTQPCCILL